MISLRKSDTVESISKFFLIGNRFQVAVRILQSWNLQSKCLRVKC